MEKIENEKKSQEIENSPLKDTSLFDILKDKEEQMIEVQKKEIPDHIMKRFEWYSKRFILPEQYKKEKFEKYRYIRHNTPAPYISYITLQEEKIAGYPEKDIYIFEQDEIGKIIWHGEIRLVESKKHVSFFKDKPIVWFNATEENFWEEKRQGKWYGKKRIQTMNKIAENVRWLKLHSDILFCDKNAKKIWERLEKEWLVKKYLEDGKERFCFI